MKNLAKVPFVPANTDMWTSMSEEPFGSFIVSYICGLSDCELSLNTVTLR